MVFWLAWKNRKLGEVEFLASFVLIPGILLFIASYLIRPVYVPRAMIASGVGFYGLAAYLINRVWKNNAGNNLKPDAAPWIISGMIVLISFLSLPNQYLFHDFPRSRFADLGWMIADRCPSETCTVIHDNKLSYFPTIIYNPGKNQQFLADQPGSFNDTLAIQSQEAMNQIAVTSIEKATEGHSRVLFITFQKAEDEYQANGEPLHPVLVQFQSLGYQMASEESLGDINIYEFAK